MICRRSLVCLRRYSIGAGVDEPKKSQFKGQFKFNYHPLLYFTAFGKQIRPYGNAENSRNWI